MWSGMPLGCMQVQAWSVSPVWNVGWAGGRWDLVLGLDHPSLSVLDSQDSRTSHCLLVHLITWARRIGRTNSHCLSA